jgi:hypothetical protein
MATGSRRGGEDVGETRGDAPPILRNDRERSALIERLREVRKRENG